MIFAELQRSGEQLVHVHRLTDDLAGRSSLTFVNKIAPAKLFRRESNSVSNFVNLAFEREDALRRTEPSERTVRRNVSRHSAAVNSDVRTDVWASGMNRPTRKHNRRERAIRAPVDNKFDLHREELAVF